MDKNFENKPEEKKPEEEIENPECPELAPLRALNQALEQRIRISTSTIQIIRNDPSTTEFVAVEGAADAPTLKCLEESVSDFIITDFPDVSEKSSFASSGASADKTGSAIAAPEDSTCRRDSASGISATSTRTGGSYFSIPSCTSSFDGVVDAEAQRRAEEAIAELQSSGPAGLVELSSLSKAVGKPIRVWLSGGGEKYRKVGRAQSDKNAIDVEYQEPPAGEEIGHWTLRGNREPQDVQGTLNDCLFDVVADQTGRLAPELRTATTELMRRNAKSLARRIEEIARLEKCERVSLMIGGARYAGTRPQDAARVIDNSQQGRCHPQGHQGHPRGHACHPDAAGLTDSAENYSQTGYKSAFLSRVDQDCVGHLALQTEKAKRAMRDLNDGATNIAIHVRPSELEPGPLPRGVDFRNGQRGGERPFRELVLVLRHHIGQHRNPDADVFVHTFYPVLQ